MNIQQLKRLITNANNLYRKGKPIMSDEKYDSYLEILATMVYEPEFKEFRSKLMEEPGKVKLTYVAGSLKKCTYGTDAFAKWIVKQFSERGGSLIESEKLDGMSFIAIYKNGKFKSASTRGDGYMAEDITEKGYIIFPQTIKAFEKYSHIETRGELMLDEKVSKELGYENARNGVSGLIQSDTYDATILEHVTPYFHGIQGPEFTHLQQLTLLTHAGLKTPSWSRIPIPKSWTTEERIKKLEEQFKKTVQYFQKEHKPADGLVIANAESYNTDDYYPEDKIAFKVNKEGVVTTVTGIQWNVTKSGWVVPIAQVEPIRIDGTTVSNVFCYNVSDLTEKGIGPGARVKVLKAGEIIPKIQEVLFKADAQLPTNCPCCNEILVYEGVNLVCNNSRNCEDQKYGIVEKFLQNFDIKGASETTLRNLELDNIYKIVDFKPNKKYKIQQTLYNEIQNKVMNKSANDIFCLLPYNGAGCSTMKKLVAQMEPWHLTNVADAYIYESNPIDEDCLPNGVGITTFNKIAKDILDNYELMKYITNHENYKKPVEKKTSSKLAGKSFCFTGTLTRKRKDLEQMVIDAGGEIKSVSKNLDYLVAGEKAGSKLTKAQQLGIMVLNETQFMEIV